MPPINWRAAASTWGGVYHSFSPLLWATWGFFSCSYSALIVVSPPRSFSFVSSSASAAMAKENKVEAGKAHGRGEQAGTEDNSVNIDRVDTREEMAKLAGVSTRTMGDMQKPPIDGEGYT